MQASNTHTKHTVSLTSVFPVCQATLCIGFHRYISHFPYPWWGEWLCKSPSKPETFHDWICGQLAAQFPDSSIFSGKAKECTAAAKETLLQFALHCPDTSHWTCKTQSWKTRSSHSDYPSREINCHLACKILALSGNTALFVIFSLALSCCWLCKFWSLKTCKSIWKSSNLRFSDKW